MLREVKSRGPHIPDDAIAGCLVCAEKDIELARLRALKEDLENALRAAGPEKEWSPVPLLREEIARLRTRIAVLEEEHAVWEKHGLVETVRKCERLTARDKAAGEMKILLAGFHHPNTRERESPEEQCDCEDCQAIEKAIRDWEEAGKNV